MFTTTDVIETFLPFEILDRLSQTALTLVKGFLINVRSIRYFVPIGSLRGNRINSYSEIS